MTAPTVPSNPVSRLTAKLARRFKLRDRESRDESGETLLEILLALIILSLASVALITAFGTSVNASAEHRRLANFNTVLASSISTTTTTMQQQSAGVFNSCQPLSAYPSSAQITAALGLSGYTAAIAASGTQPAVEYSNNGAYSTNCTADDVSNPQLINVVVTNTATGFTQSNTVVVDNPNVNQTSGAVGAGADQLVFITQPEGATVGNNFATQPQIEVEDDGVIVTSDLSPITLTIASGPAGASLSSTCSGQETAGIISYTGCSLNVIGSTYTLLASEPDPSHPGIPLTSTSAPFSVYASQLNTPNITAVIPSVTTAGAINVSFTGAANAPAGQVYSVKACQDSAMSVNCVVRNNFVSGTDVTALTTGMNYWAAVSATPSQNFLGSTSPPVGPTLATVQLTPPTTLVLSFGPTSGSVTVVSFNGSLGAPANQIYTALACQNSSMTLNCVTNTNIVTGNAVSGLSPGVTYNVELSANASTGYLASGRSTPPATQAASTAVKTPSGFSSSPSLTQVGAITAAFIPGGSPAPSSYTATVCTNSAMTLNCLPFLNYAPGAQITGLTPGTSYFVTITANSSTTGVASSTTAVSGPTLATVQLTAPTAVVVGFGITAGSVSITAGPSNGPAGETYTSVACTNTQMTAGCVTNANYTLGNDITGLHVTIGAAGTTYFVQLTANGSLGYLVSPASAQASGAETSQLGPPTNLTVTSPTTRELTISFTAPTGTAPIAYNVEICTNQNMTGTCTTKNNFVSGSQITGLTTNTRYWTTVTAIAPVGFVNSTTETNATTKVN